MPGVVIERGLTFTAAKAANMSAARSSAPPSSRVVVTVDEHGLKRKYLKGHARAVAAFFDGLAERIFESDASKALQERLLRNRERLFTFLQHDGVSWTTIWPRMRSSASPITGKMLDEASKKQGLPSIWYC